jgi:hypothetical protein
LEDKPANVTKLWPDIRITCRCGEFVVRYQWNTNEGVWKPKDKHAVTERFFRGDRPGWVTAEELESPEDIGSGRFRARHDIRCKCHNELRADSQTLTLAFALALGDGLTTVSLDELRAYYRRVAAGLKQ